MQAISVLTHMSYVGGQSGAVATRTQVRGSGNGVCTALQRNPVNEAILCGGCGTGTLAATMPDSHQHTGM